MQVQYSEAGSEGRLSSSDRRLYKYPLTPYDDDINATAKMAVMTNSSEVRGMEEDVGCAVQTSRWLGMRLAWGGRDGR